MGLSTSGYGYQPFDPTFRMPQTAGAAYKPEVSGFPGIPMPVSKTGSEGDSFTLSNPTATSNSQDSTKPDISLIKFSQLTPEKVNSKGKVKGILFDVDDTLSKFTLGNRSIPPELVKQLKTLQDSGIKLGIVTNNPNKTTALKVQKELKDAGINMPMVIHAEKPSPNGLEAMQKEMGLPASQMMMVGDQATDVESGKKAGFKTTQVDWFGTSGLHNKMMHLADKALLELDEFKAKFDSDPDQPEFIPAAKSETSPTKSQAKSG
jgi:HAD superfamily phosphatase (TIGR01668 family)